MITLPTKDFARLVLLERVFEAINSIMKGLGADMADASVVYNRFMVHELVHSIELRLATFLVASIRLAGVGVINIPLMSFQLFGSIKEAVTCYAATAVTLWMKLRIGDVLRIGSRRQDLFAEGIGAGLAVVPRVMSIPGWPRIASLATKITSNRHDMCVMRAEVRKAFIADVSVPLAATWYIAHYRIE